jgi:hypothetical protein
MSFISKAKKVVKSKLFIWAVTIALALVTGDKTKVVSTIEDAIMSTDSTYVSD